MKYYSNSGMNKLCQNFHVYTTQIYTCTTDTYTKCDAEKYWKCV